MEVRERGLEDLDSLTVTSKGSSSCNYQTTTGGRDHVVGGRLYGRCRLALRYSVGVCSVVLYMVYHSSAGNAHCRTARIGSQRQGEERLRDAERNTRYTGFESTCGRPCIVRPL